MFMAFLGGMVMLAVIIVTLVFGAMIGFKIALGPNEKDAEKKHSGRYPWGSDKNASEPEPKLKPEQVYKDISITCDTATSEPCAHTMDWLKMSIEKNLRDAKEEGVSIETVEDYSNYLDKKIEALKGNDDDGDDPDAYAESIH